MFCMNDLPTLCHSVSCVLLVDINGAGYWWRGLSSSVIPTPVTSSQNNVCSWVAEVFWMLFPGFGLSVLECAASPRWTDAVLQGLCFGVSFEDTSLSTLPSFLCHTGGFFCSLPHCLLIRLNVASNLSYLFCPSLQNQSINLGCALADNNLPPTQAASHYITFNFFIYIPLILCWILFLYVKVMCYDPLPVIGWRVNPPLPTSSILSLSPSPSLSLFPAHTLILPYPMSHWRVCIKV